MINVHPVNDIREHRLDTTCDCYPTVEFLKQILVIHNSFDGREKLERITGGKPNSWLVTED